MRIGIKSYSKMNQISALLAFITFFSASNFTQSFAANTNFKPLVNTNALKHIIFGNGCGGRSDYPHISKHFPGTVNVTALSECPGKEVTVSTTLSRKGWWIFREGRNLTKSGFRRVIVNVALNCKWREGGAPIEYIVESVHYDKDGEFGRTRLRSFLNC